MLCSNTTLELYNLYGNIYWWKQFCPSPYKGTEMSTPNLEMSLETMQQLNNVLNI